jgi:tyrosinase
MLSNFYRHLISTTLTRHRNIDRLFAIWQALHEDDLKAETYVTTQTTEGGTFSVKAGSKETIDTKLWPFRKSTATNDWYTSGNVKRTEDFGYSYPETAGLQYPTSSSAKAALGRVIQNYYTPLWSMIRSSRNGDRNAGSDLLSQAELLKTIQDKKATANTSQMMSLVSQMPDNHTLLERSLEPSKPLIKDLAPQNKYLEWLVNIKAVKHTLDGAFTVHVFLGPVQEERALLWPASPNHVGTFATFGQSQDTECTKCQQDQADNMEVTGQIPLTLALTERYLAGILPDLSEDNVVPFLTQNLHWRAAQVSHNLFMFTLSFSSPLDGLLSQVCTHRLT